MCVVLALRIDARRFKPCCIYSRAIVLVFARYSNFVCRMCYSRVRTSAIKLDIWKQNWGIALKNCLRKRRGFCNAINGRSGGIFLSTCFDILHLCAIILRAAFCEQCEYRNAFKIFHVFVAYNFFARYNNFFCRLILFWPDENQRY